ncbi:MAG: threonine synthase [Muribaculaceae bacterium]
MRLVSTTGKSRASLAEAVLHPFAADGSLYLPEATPVIPRAFFNNMSEMTIEEISYVVANTLLGEDIASSKLKSIVESTLTGAIRIHRLDDSTAIAELYHSPTLAYKDISTYFMCRAINELRGMPRHPNFIVATTGNTGASIANACHATHSGNAIILYPHGTLSRAQQSQFTTLGSNVYPVEVAGTIDDCKTIIKQLFADPELCAQYHLVSANTINILRIVPQVFYFFYLWSRLGAASKTPLDIAVPSGNMSNLLAGALAKKMGLPIGRLIAGCNATGIALSSLLHDAPDAGATLRRRTIASAMDSGRPTNLPRLAALYGGNTELMRRDIAAYIITDDEIATTILSTGDYAIDPHTAVGLAALRSYGSANGVALATAHPAKSLDVMTTVTGRAMELPLQLTRFMSRPKPSIHIAPTLAAIKRYVLDTLS